MTSGHGCQAPDVGSDVAWRLALVMPNLELRGYHPDESGHAGAGALHPDLTLGSSFVAVVPPSEPRAKRIAASDRAARALLCGFHGTQGEAVAPSALLVRTDAPEPVQSMPALIAFRNALAIPILLKARAGAEPGVGGWQPHWSDTFDFHPTFPVGEDGLATLSPALRSFGLQAERYKATPSPYMPIVGRQMVTDRALAGLLASEWRRRWESDDDDQWGRVLFRSLECAYWAMSADLKNFESLQDYGFQLAQWVSAVEVLVSSAPGGGSVESAWALLGEFAWPNAALQEQVQCTIGKRTRNFDVVQRIYGHINRARNDFLHGNPVSADTFFMHRSQSAHSGSKQPSLLQLCATVYRTALMSYLRHRHPAADRMAMDHLDRVMAMVDDYDYILSLKRSLGIAGEA